MPIYPNTNLLLTTTNSSTSILPNSITTPFISTQSLSSSNGYGATGTILSTTGSSIQWITSPNQIDPINIQNNIDMNTNNIINATTVNCTNLYTSGISGPATFTNPVTFNTPPISVTPTTSSQLATKSYVDAALSNGIYLLYFNLSEPISSTSFSRLSNTRTTSSYQSITTTTGAPGTSVLIKSFLTNPIGISQLPISLWSFNIYGTINVITDPTNYYAVCELYRNNGVIATIGISNNSANHIALTSTLLPYIYKLNISLSSPYIIEPTDQMLISLYTFTVSGTGSRTVTTYFEDKFLSYVQIQTTSPLTLLPSNPQWISTANSNLNMNGYNISSIGDMSIQCTGKILSIGNDSSILNIGTDSSTATNINLLAAASTGSIETNRRFNINYTNLPTTSQIGQIITTTVANSSFTFVSGQEKLTNSYTISPGVWIVTANVGFIIGATSCAPSKIELYIQIGTTLICKQQFSIAGESRNTWTHILCCSGFFSITTTSTVNLYQKVTFTGGPIQNSGSDYSANFVRVA
jgi:hypothetical protein